MFEVSHADRINNLLRLPSVYKSYPGQQTHPVPPECSLQVFGFTSEGTPVSAGLLTESSSQTPTPIYVRGERVRVVPLRKDKDPIQVDSAADSKQDIKPRVENGEAHETKHLATGMRDEVDAITPRTSGDVVDLDALPDADADAKLERLPSNTPVLRAWGEAAGVEHRWRSRSRYASDADALDAAGAHGGSGSGMAYSGASYVSNAATVELADSDADSKEESSNNSPTSSLRDGTWSRYSTLDDVIATALPMLSAVSSDVSDAERPGLGSVAAGAAAIGSSIPTRVGGDGAAGTEGDGVVNGSSGLEEKGRDSMGSSRPRASSWAENVEEKKGQQDCAVEHERNSSATLPWNWAVRVQTAAMPRKARLRLYLEKRSSLPSRGPTLEEAREYMRAWTPEMDKSLLELLGAAGTKAVSLSRCLGVRTAKPTKNEGVALNKEFLFLRVDETWLSFYCGFRQNLFISQQTMERSHSLPASSAVSRFVRIFFIDSFRKKKRRRGEYRMR